MGTVVKYDNIFQYNESRGVETLHPLVSVIDFSKAEPIPPGHYRHCFGFYAVFLKDVKCGDLRYGRNLRLSGGNARIHGSGAGGRGGGEG